MDFLPSEIWYLILGRVHFGSRIVCSSWLGLIDAHPNFSEQMDHVREMRELPNNIADLVYRREEFVQEMKKKISDVYPITID